MTLPQPLYFQHELLPRALDMFGTQDAPTHDAGAAESGLRVGEAVRLRAIGIYHDTALEEQTETKRQRGGGAEQPETNSKAEFRCTLCGQWHVSGVGLCPTLVSRLEHQIAEALATRKP